MSLSFGQDNSVQYQASDTAVLYSSDFDAEEISNYIQSKKLRLSVEVGTVFATSPGYGSYFSTYLAPHLSYQLSQKFTLSGGLKLINYQGGFDYFGSDYLYQPFGNYAYRPVSLVYMEGAYQFNEKLTFTGAAYHQINTFKNPTEFNNDLKGFIMGVDYKIGENAVIRGQVEFSNGYRGFGNYPGVNPWQRNYFSPAGGLNDPF